jgi:nicotinamide-nucleotide amidase
MVVCRFAFGGILPMFPEAMKGEAAALLDVLRQRELKLATAESCTGGLIVALLTEIPGSSDVVDRGFVTYSNAAKTEMLGVPDRLIAEHGAVSRDVALAMASGAIAYSLAQLAVAVTGMAGPGGGGAQKPVGLVHLAAARLGRPPLHQECRFGDIGRYQIRIKSVEAALALIRRAADITSEPKPD